MNLANDPSASLPALDTSTQSFAGWERISAVAPGAATLSDDELTRLRRDKLGFIFRFFNLLTSLSCLENVALPLHLRGWLRKIVPPRSSTWFSWATAWIMCPMNSPEASGQRVAIARALTVYPPILLADEPTGNLDTRTGARILKLIRDLHERLGSTVFMVTHDMSVAESCPRTISLRDARVIGDVRR